MSDTWYISRDGKQREGPFQASQVRAMLGTGQLRPHMLGWSQGRADWAPLSAIEELGMAPPPLPMKTLIEPDAMRTIAPPAPSARALHAQAPPPMPPVVMPPPAQAVAIPASLPAPATPAHALDTRPAGFLLRLVAIVIDSLIVGTVGLCAQFVIGFALGLLMRASDGKISMEEIAPFFMGLSLLTSLSVAWIYYAGMESSRRQATLGKLAAGVRVTGLDGHRVRFAQATGRFFAKLLSALTLGIGYLMVLWTQRKQGLHDILAGTLVLRGAVPLESTDR